MRGEKLKNQKLDHFYVHGNPKRLGKAGKVRGYIIEGKLYTTIAKDPWT